MSDDRLRRRRRPAGGDCAQNIPIDAHRGTHWDFLYRYQREAQCVAAASRRQRGEFADSLFGKLSDERCLMCAIDKIAEEDRAPGPNGLQIEDLSRQQRWQLAKVLQDALRDGTYQPGTVRQVPIPKTSGSGTRLIEIPDLQDKVVQRGALQILQPFVDPTWVGERM